MAKRFGVSDEIIQAMNEGLKNAAQFTERELAALEFAYMMTMESKEMDMALWERLRKYFDEGEIIELACVIGTFNYFNRFNNVLQVDITK